MRPSDFYDLTPFHAPIRIRRHRRSPVSLEWLRNDVPVDTSGYSSPECMFATSFDADQLSVPATLNGAGLWTFTFGATEWAAIGDAGSGHYELSALNGEGQRTVLVAGEVDIQEGFDPS